MIDNPKDEALRESDGVCDKRERQSSGGRGGMWERLGCHPVGPAKIYIRNKNWLDRLSIPPARVQLDDLTIF